MEDAHTLDSILKQINNSLPRKLDYIKKEPVAPTLCSKAYMAMGLSAPYTPIRVQESCNSKLVGILIAHPNTPLSKRQIVGKLDYYHHRSGDAVDFFCVGFGAYWPKGYYRDQQKVTKINGADWYFSNKAFTNVIEQLEAESKWQYSGETELLLMMAKKDPNGITSLDFDSSIVCNLDSMVLNNAISSVGNFFESIFRFARNNDSSGDVLRYSDQQGFQVVQSALKEVVLSLLPKQIEDSFKKAEHFAVRSIK
ncbi:TPA: hypothetical protein I7117_15060 [Vibrio vulnificus]|uniref:hypothetical protein n=1 Tax=Vibrio navarrensis TaxID=29495 RepID=UPI0018DDAEAE|nr:hypothetical protein [Vibrio navarrensis]EHA1126418.1 hypothetical protein [Vibrio navarrensis]MBH9739987.1 hypothetical protein [Vibrio navarrensis]HAS6100782.1 hypothetical protein [Vibrio vulnificus]HDY8121328.1 hypothetical protein [Vibrio vulnificus]